MKKLAYICCSAVLALSLTGCPGNNDNPDTGGTTDKGDTGTPDTGGVPGLDASMPPDASCTPNCPTGAACGANGCGGVCGTGCAATDTCVNYKCEVIGSCRDLACKNMECGPDNCTPPGVCGTCASDKQCVSGKCVVVDECWKTKCAGRECGDSTCASNPSCGTCPDGKQCNAAGMCIVKVCDPACGEEQWCDVTQDPAVCLEICDPPNGCKDTEECVKDTTDPTTGTCTPPSCNGVQCKPGQLCIDFSDTAVPDEHCSCTPDYSYQGVDYPDTCLEYGLVCGMDNSTAAGIIPSECKKPGEFQDCLPSVGCETPANGGKLDCMKLNPAYPAMCLRSCAKGAAADPSLCTETFTACYGGSIKNHCYYNICAYADDLDCDPKLAACKAERAKLMAPCDSSGEGDGTCQAWAFSDGSEVGVCVQGGTAKTECDPNAVRVANATSYPAMCEVGSLCMGVMPDPADPTKEKGLCAPFCNAAMGADATPTLGCDAATDKCFDQSGAPDSVTVTRLGLCLPKCDMFGTAQCPNDLLGNKAGCWTSPDLDGTGYCRAVSPTAGKYGDVCQYKDDNDSRNICGDRLICVAYGDEPGNCLGFCKSSVCTSKTAVCNECAGSICCEAKCTGKCNGEDDGCGGKCGCEAGFKCNTTATPNACEACTPACTDKCNGEDDGCGGKCGCQAGFKCNTTASPNACEACTADCAGKCSGQDDGCGGKCTCEAGKKCDTTASPNVCADCTPTCAAGKCGMDDGCGGKCGCATVGDWCSVAGDCKSSCTVKTECPATAPVCELPVVVGDAGVVTGTCKCVPDCVNKLCGDDGCGGTCGTACAATEKCIVPAAGVGLVCAGFAKTDPVTPAFLCQPK